MTKISTDSAFRMFAGRSVEARRLKADGSLTIPRSWGVYELPSRHGSSRRIRFGNHPVRMRELEEEFGSCALQYLFLTRDDAKAVADFLNVRGSHP